MDDMKQDRSIILESVAKVIVINKEGKALVLILGRHLKYPDKSYRPDLPGGIVDFGESERDAVIREAQEECGIDLKELDVQLAYTKSARYEKEGKSVTKLLYVAHLEYTPEITLSWEHSDYQWVSIDKLQALDLGRFFNEAIEYLATNRII